VVGFLLDAKIRRATDGAKSLDDRDLRLLSVQRRDDLAVVGFVHREIDDGNAAVLRQDLESVVGSVDCKEIILDFGNLKHFGSAGLAALITLYRRANAAGKRLSLCNLGPKERRLFQEAKMDLIFTIKETMPELPADTDGTRSPAAPEPPRPQRKRPSPRGRRGRR
jgi:anti-anti-sigma factor